jgi:phosphoenolpyruvate carboxykinase (ATP)
MFGLTATGKSTWSCHQLGLDVEQGEGTWVSQDDIVFLRRDGSSYGTELGFYVKTDVDVKLQEAMYNALVHHTALLENVMVDAKGKIDFLDERLGENGRGVLDRRELKVKRGRKMESICADTINTANLEEVDGIVFAFITRRGTIMPFAQRLTPEQGVMAYLWGESTHSFATVPAKAGDSVRIVGMDDFIIGAQGRKVNTFYDIVMDLVARYPGKVHFFQYNTGGMGEIIDVDKATGKKKQVRKVTRVPIDLMAALQRGDLRGTNEYAKGRLGTEYVVKAEGTELGQYDAHNFYSDEQIEAYVADLVDGRRKFTELIAEQGLRKDIREIAHRELDAIDATTRKKAEPWVPAEEREQTAAEDRDPRSKWISPWEQRRPSAGHFPLPAKRR